jgi:biopolymer transport protein ExbD
MRLRKKGSGVAEGDLTPMIDMTFQLIAFFMVLVNFSEAEQDQRVKLPESELAKPPEAPFEEPITLQMTKDGDIILHGDTLTMSVMDRRMLREREILKSMGKSPADATIIIRAHEDCATGKVQELIKICQLQQFERFALRAKEKQSY